MKESRTDPLRLPRAPKDPVVSAMETARLFADRKARADFEAFDRILRRPGGEPPREGDELP